MTLIEHADAPTTDWDPFSREGLASPDQTDRVLLEAGEVVWVAAHGVWAVARFDLVDSILRDPATFESSSGAGLTNVKQVENWRKPSVILENDPPAHGTYRRVMASVLSPRVVRRLTEGFQAVADRLVADVVGRGEFDAARELAEAFPMAVLPDALGLAKEGREHLLTYSSLNFNAAGPRNEFYDRAVVAAEGATAFVHWQMRREAIESSGLGMIIFQAADDGEISEEDAEMLVRTFLSAGLDTTIHGIQNTLKALVDTPAAWDALSADPGLARTVFEESLRRFAPSPYLARTTTREVELGGVRMGSAEKVLLAVGAANRDPRRWDRPDEFDIERDTSGHLGFGTGIHGCVGQMMARMEATCILTSIAKQVERLELVGEPVRLYNNWLRGWDSLPMRATKKA